MTIKHDGLYIEMPPTSDYENDYEPDRLLLPAAEIAGVTIHIGAHDHDDRKSRPSLTIFHEDGLGVADEFRTVLTSHESYIIRGIAKRMKDQMGVQVN